MAAGTEISPAQLEALLAAVSVEAKPIDKGDTVSVEYVVVNNRVVVHSVGEKNDAYILTVDPASGTIRTTAISAKHLGTRDKALGALKRAGALHTQGQVVGNVGRIMYSSSTSHGISGSHGTVGYLGHVVESDDFDTFSVSMHLPEHEQVADRAESSKETHRVDQAISEAILEAEFKGLSAYLDSVSSKVETFVSRQEEKRAARAEG